MYDDIRKRIKRLQLVDGVKNGIYFAHYPEPLPDNLPSKCHVVFCSIAPDTGNERNETDRKYAEWGSMIAAECQRRSFTAAWIGGAYQNRGNPNV